MLSEVKVSELADNVTPKEPIYMAKTTYIFQYKIKMAESGGIAETVNQVAI